MSKEPEVGDVWINETKAKELVKKYCPDVMLVMNDGSDGLYLHNSREILIGKNWHIAGLLHEITHAVLNADEPRTCHDGVFADKFTQIVHEVFEKENIKLKKQLSKALYTFEVLAEDDEEYIRFEAKRALKRIKRLERS